jgi:hypothetical protein
VILSCPLCGARPCLRVLQDYRVCLRSRGESDLGGLAVYQCDYGHIFLVRIADSQPEGRHNVA